MASIGQTISGPRFHETDEVGDFSYMLCSSYGGVQWFDRKRAYLDSLESQLRGLVKAIETVARHRAGKHQSILNFSSQSSSNMIAELAIASAEFAQTVSDLSASDVGKQLSISLAGLAEVEQKAHNIQDAQAEQDMVTLMSTGEIMFIPLFLFLTIRGA